MTGAAVLEEVAAEAPAGEAGDPGRPLPHDAGIVVTQPGLYPDMSEETYHRDPVPGGSLSSTGARKLLPPSCPAQFRHDADNPKPYVPELALGQAAHHVVLGTGPEIVVIDAADWRTKKAKTERKTAHENGQIPLLTHQFDQVQAMADALRRHPRAIEILTEADGAPEQSLFWRDPETGVWCRARPDLMTPWALVDYKTTTDAHPYAVAKAVANYDYHVQAAHYLAGAVELDLVDPDAPFYFVFQSKQAPYLVTVAELDDDALDVGRERLADARRIYVACMESGVWPDYGDDIELISLPAYARR